jgi:NAD(P)-dependent dehydrogenase (short-subunit alcohol dehydrogenase family)
MISCIIRCLGQEWAQSLGKESEPLDYAIYVAGVVDDWADLDEVDESRMLHCFKVNTIGPLLTAQALIRQQLLAKGSVLAILTSKVTLCSVCAELACTATSCIQMPLCTDLERAFSPRIFLIFCYVALLIAL